MADALRFVGGRLETGVEDHKHVEWQACEMSAQEEAKQLGCLSCFACYGVLLLVFSCAPHGGLLGGSLETATCLPFLITESSGLFVRWLASKSPGTRFLAANTWVSSLHVSFNYCYLFKPETLILEGSLAEEGHLRGGGAPSSFGGGGQQDRTLHGVCSEGLG